ncbi:sigma-70 family RNA polymerase sigma factor [Verrucomicrobiota bacterium]
MNEQYLKWQQEPTPENLSGLVDNLSPVITSEIQRYKGPKILLRGQAKLLTIKAIKNYNPKYGAALSSWVVSQLQPLNRYSHNLKPIGVSELNTRKAAEINNVTNKLTSKLGRMPTDIELADDIGISTKKINKIRNQVKPVMTEGELAVDDVDNERTFEPALSTVNTLGLAKDIVYKNLPEKHRIVFDLKTGIKGQVLSNKVIAKQLGVSPSMVTQMSNDIAKKIIEVNKHAI